MNMFHIKINHRMTKHPKIANVVMCESCGDWYCLKCEKHLHDCPCITQG